MAPYRIVFVCLGNICRSPMAEVVMRRLVDEAGLGDAVEVSSAGTGDWHVGEGADARTIRVLADRGYDARSHRARQFVAEWFDDHDLVVALDRANLATLRRLAPVGREDDVRLLMSFDQDSDPDVDVPDPYYDEVSGFEDALAMIDRACRGLVTDLAGRIG